MYSSPGIADFDVQKIIKMDHDTVSNEFNHTKEDAFIVMGGVSQSLQGAIRPGEKFIDSINRERKNLGLYPFNDEEDMEDNYKDVFDAIDRAVAIDNGFIKIIKEENEKKNDEPELAGQNMINEEPASERSSTGSEMSGQNKINLDEPEEDDLSSERNSVSSEMSGDNNSNMDEPEEEASSERSSVSSEMSGQKASTI